MQEASWLHKKIYWVIFDSSNIDKATWVSETINIVPHQTLTNHSRSTTSPSQLELSLPSSMVSLHGSKVILRCLGESFHGLRVSLHGSRDEPLWCHYESLRLQCEPLRLQSGRLRLQAPGSLAPEWASTAPR